MAARFLDLTAPGFSTRSADVIAAQSADWYAHTPFGFAVLRHREAGLLLRDKRLRQGSHAWPELMGLRGPFADFWSGSVIAMEGPGHKALRQVFQQALPPARIAALAPEFGTIAAGLLDRIQGREEVEFMAEFALPFSGQAICAVLGLDRGIWPVIAADAASLGRAMGIDAAQHAAEINGATLRLRTIAAELLDNGGSDFAAHIRTADMSRQAAINLVMIAIFGGVDTTKAQLGNLMALFADHPREWRKLCRDPSRVPDAIEDGIRAFPTTTWATREAIADFTFGDLAIRRGARLHILTHATARDPARNDGANCGAAGFDITAQRPAHFGFGGGAHHCLGAAIARADMAAALREICARFAEVRPARPATFLPDSGNTGPESLYLRLMLRG